MRHNIKKPRSTSSLIRDFRKIVADRDIRGAIDFQISLIDLIISRGEISGTKSVCAFDVSYEKNSNTNFATAVILSYPELQIMESSYVVEKALFPYVPGLLAFREGMAILDLFRKLKHKPDILIFDGHGIAHPRHMGIATLMGILLNMPSIGCAKSRLVGEYEEPGNAKGSFSRLMLNNRVIGYVLRSRAGVKPIFVSVGHKIDIKSAMKIILNCCIKYRVPEPIRAAHNLANEIRIKKATN